MNPKKLSPTKIGAFGQTAQLASKIRNLMDSSKGGEWVNSFLKTKAM